MSNSISIARCRATLPVLAAATFGWGASLAQTTVTPPPRPPGAAQISVSPGLDPDEVLRSKRAHRHGFVQPHDPSIDDSLRPPVSPQPEVTPTVVPDVSIPAPVSPFGPTPGSSK